MVFDTGGEAGRLATGVTPEKAAAELAEEVRSAVEEGPLRVRFEIPNALLPPSSQPERRGHR